MTRSARHLREQVKDAVSELPIHAARLAVMGVGRALLLTDRVRKDYRDVRESGFGPVLGRLKNDAEAITGMVVARISGNGKGQEEAKVRTADSEISVGKPKPAASAQRPATPPKPPAAPPRRPAATKPTTPKPATKPVSKPAEKPAERPTAARPKAEPAAEPKTGPKAESKIEPKAETATEPAAKPKPAASKPATPKPAAKAKAAADLPITGYDEASLASVRARLRNLDAKQVGELRDYERANAARAEFLRMYENRIAKLSGQG